MLDGLLGRSGFYSKCKSLIKQTRTRIDVAKRKQNATQKFMKKDIADLLANHLETNADAKAERLIMDQNLLSCYDLIDHDCEIIMKSLSVLQKHRECPEECREAVGSLMFAAARFSDLPELRELRDLFQERFGSSLEYYVNQKLVENITPESPSVEKKVQLMQEIALDFSIQWDGRAYQKRMSKPCTTEKNQRHSPGTVRAVERDEVLVKNRNDLYQNNGRHTVIGRLIENARDGTTGRRDNLMQDVHKEQVQVKTDRRKSDFRDEIPPPYVKPRQSKHKSDLGSRLEIDGQVRLTEIYYKDASSGEFDFVPRRRSHRRKHSRSLSSSQDDKIGEEQRFMNRVSSSSSRRKHESRKGLQIVFDDEHYKKVDKEERIMDELLLHYSKKKPSLPDRSEKTNTKTKTKTETESVSEMKVGIEIPVTSRSRSFPSRKQVDDMALPEPEREPQKQQILARASSLNQEFPAKHVHPKLPNYDDLATRFTALRVCKS